MIKKRLIMLIPLLMAHTVFADTYNDALKELGGLGTGVTNNITSPKEYTPRYNANPEFADQYYGGGLTLPTDFGKDKINRCKSEKAQEDLYLRQECEGVNLVTQNETVRPDVTLSANEKLVTGAQTIAGDPKETLDKYRWKYPLNDDGTVGDIPTTACSTETIDVPLVQKEKQCSQYIGMESFLCQAVLKVTVDPNFNYSCLETKYKNEIHECGQKLKVVCQQAPDCTLEGIQASSIEGDMEVTFIPSSHGNTTHSLTFGTIGDNYWGPGEYERHLSLNVIGKERITSFKLAEAHYDDWLVVTINGNVVYSDANGKMLYRKYDEIVADSLKERGSIFGKGKKKIIGLWSVLDQDNNRIGAVERGTSWHKILNIDLMPYLKEGINNISTKTLVGGKGESSIIIQANQYCKPICHESWENKCEGLEKRVIK